jgi:hypothetical protein
MLLLAVLRTFAFPLYESPRYLLGRGHDEAAVAVVREIARYNGTESSLTVEDLQEAAQSAEHKEGAYRWRVLSDSSAWRANHVRALFSTKKMAWSTSLLIWIWGMYQISRCNDYEYKWHPGRAHRPRIDTLQQFPAIPVGLHLSRSLRVCSRKRMIQSSQPRSEVPGCDVCHRLPQRQ